MTIQAQAPIKPRKSAAVIKLLSRTKGAASAEMMAATNWQPHSVRAFLSGLRKKGQVLEREARKNGEAGYRLVESARVVPAAEEPVPPADDASTLNGGPAADAGTAAQAA